MASQGRTYNSSDAALFNLPLCLELALNQGRRFHGKARIEGHAASAPHAASLRVEDLRSVLEAFRPRSATGLTTW